VGEVEEEEGGGKGLLLAKYFMVFHSRISFGKILEFFERMKRKKKKRKRGTSNNHNNNNTQRE